METKNNIQLSNEIKRANRKKKTDKIVRIIFLLITTICASIIFVVLGFILVKGLTPFFKTYSENGNPEAKMSFSFLLFGNIFNGGYDAKTNTYHYGAGFLFVNTILLNLLTAILAIPTGVLTALFIVRIAPKKLGKVIETGVDLLAAIPSVIFGIFGLGVIVPIIKNICQAIGLVSVSGISMLAGAIVLSLMIIPTIVSVSVTALKAVDENQIKGSLALGASPTQTNFKIALRGAKSGIFAGIILGLGRSLGEATAISMVCGSPLRNITWNPLNPVTTLSSEILLAFGEASYGSLNYDARFSAGILLMVLILITNLILNDVKNHISSIDKKPIFIVKVYMNIKALISIIKEKIKRKKGIKE